MSDSHPSTGSPKRYKDLPAGTTVESGGLADDLDHEEQQSLVAEDSNFHAETVPTSRSRSASPLHLRARSGSLDSWDEEEEAGLNRYNLDYKTEIPLPAEFTQSFLARMWHSFLELRVAARQRRAARLLTMPSESFQYKLHACLLTWCCDATDRGILLVLFGILAWLMIGGLFHLDVYWWTTGVLLIFVRFSARRLCRAPGTIVQGFLPVVGH
jgi:hypothetical protein